MTPTTEQQRQYQELEAAIMRKCYPEAVYDEQYGEWAIPNGNGGFFWKKPWLEDVLRALQKCVKVRHGWLEVTPWGRFNLYFNKEYEIESDEITDFTDWDLGKPFSDQSDECKKFLHSLLKE